MTVSLLTRWFIDDVHGILFHPQFEAEILNLDLNSVRTSEVCDRANIGAITPELLLTPVFWLTWTLALLTLGRP